MASVRRASSVLTVCGLAVAGVSGSMVLSGCAQNGSGHHGSAAASAVAHSSSSQASGASSSGASGAAQGSSGNASSASDGALTTQPVSTGSLSNSFNSLARSLHVPAGIAIAPVGGRTSIAMGSWQSGPAWSTSKIPVSIAAQQRFGGSVYRYEVPTIVNSDNDAAQAMWNKLGGGTRAAAATSGVLRAGGDGGTYVQPYVTRPTFTAFGQTQWSLSNQATFAAHLPCMSSAQTVLGLMSHVGGDQQWGAYGLPSARVKGGWGPGTHGDYLVRQVAIIRTPRGQVAVTMAADAASFDAGKADLNRMASWLRSNLGSLPAGHC